MKQAISNANSKSVILLNNEQIFKSAIEASKEFNVDPSSICKSCKGKVKSAGKHPITGEPLVWMYYDEWLKLKDGECNK